MTQPAVLVSQQCTTSFPDCERLDDAVLWNYSFSFDGAADHSFAVTYNEDRTTAYTMALHDADGIAEMRITASSGELPCVLLKDATNVPSGDASRFRHEDGTLLLFADARERQRWTVVFSRLAVLDVQSARATVGDASFHEPALPYVQNARPIGIGGAEASISVHLTAALRTLLGHSPFAAQPASIECRYGYAIGGVAIEAPVVLLARQDVAIGFDEELIEQVESAIRQWLGAVQPPPADARLLFALTFWSAIAQNDAPLLRLTSLTLPMTDVVL